MKGKKLSSQDQMILQILIERDIIEKSYPVEALYNPDLDSGNNMAPEEHIRILRQGRHVWNKWRSQHPEVLPNISRYNLAGAHFSGGNFNGALLIGTDFAGAYLNGTQFERAYLIEGNLTKAELIRASFLRANLTGTDLIDANLLRADLTGANLTGADLTNANLTEANLTEADLTNANLTNANLTRANLSKATLVRTNMTNATLKGCNIYGISAWDVRLDGAEQLDLTITPEDLPTITVDNLKLAQFIYLLLNNAEIREVIDTIAKKAILILGRFTPERKAILDALREALRTYGYVPILFDFDKPSSQDLTESVSTLAHLSRFIIVDLTDPSSTPYEVGTIASSHIRPIQALFHPSDKAKRVFAMFPDLVRRYHWVLPPYEYQDQGHLLASLQTKVIEPAEQKAQELEKP